MWALLLIFVFKFLCTLVCTFSVEYELTPSSTWDGSQNRDLHIHSCTILYTEPIMCKLNLCTVLHNCAMCVFNLQFCAFPHNCTTGRLPRLCIFTICLLHTIQTQYHNCTKLHMVAHNPNTCARFTIAHNCMWLHTNQTLLHNCT